MAKKPFPFDAQPPVKGKKPPAKSGAPMKKPAGKRGC